MGLWGVVVFVSVEGDLVDLGGGLDGSCSDGYGVEGRMSPL